MKLNAKSAPSFATLVRHWPEALPLVALGGTGRHVVVATAFSEVGWDDVGNTPLVAKPRLDDLPFRSGWIGLRSYEGAHRVFRVDRALVVDREAGEATLTGDNAANSAFVLPNAVLGRLLEEAELVAPAPALQLAAERPEESYLADVERALADIRAGRYYQINLLRYFRVLGEPPRAQLAARLDAMGGPHAAAFEIPGLSLWSFSPERFLRMRPRGDELLLETRPIKGTAPREADPAADGRAAAALLQSPKDRAELAMIVDLMRNDLARVSRRGSVEVASPLHLLTIANVHHLEASVTSRLRPGLTLEDLLEATCPGGSVTGAPKVEVMRAIREYEGRDRGYFMGNAFYLDDSGAFDSSILIRTLARGAGPSSRNHYEFAAGSGIVVNSRPVAECREIDAKARVLTAW